MAELYVTHLGAADALPLDAPELVDPTEHSELPGGLDANGVMWLVYQIDIGRRSKVWLYGEE